MKNISRVNACENFETLKFKANGSNLAFDFLRVAIDPLHSTPHCFPKKDTLHNVNENDGYDVCASAPVISQMMRIEERAPRTSER
jgi:hypothetical protein